QGKGREAVHGESQAEDTEDIRGYIHEPRSRNIHKHGRSGKDEYLVNDYQAIVLRKDLAGISTLRTAVNEFG
ncbi:MAG: hypothetical protein P8123_09055, partial [bacterium]